MGTRLKRLVATLQMCTHNICFYGEKYPRIITQYSSSSKKSSARPHFVCLLAVQDMCKNKHEGIRKSQQESSMISERVPFDQITVLILHLRTGRPTMFATHPPNLHTFTDIIKKSCLFNVDPVKPHFYIVKLGFTGVYIIFLISAQKHRLWILVRRVSTIYVLSRTI